ncbi:MAG TPA: tetratricopeptide repeat protein [Nitrospirae bacterium]|nr:tetratricopeptide repeat protein [Nitrospirota bacterium]
MQNNVTNHAYEFFIKAGEKYKQGLLRESIKYYKRALAAYPLFVEAILDLSATLIELGETNEALHYLENALVLIPNHPEILNNYANIIYTVDGPKSALPFYEKALINKPDSLEIKKNFTLCLQLTGEIQKARQLYEEILQDDPYNHQILFNLSQIFYSAKQFDRTLEFLNRALKINPKDPESLNLLGLTFEALQNSKTAEGCFKRAIQLDKNNYRYYFNLANLHSRNGDTQKAIELYQKVVSLKPDFKDGWIQLGNHLKSNKRYEEAISVFNNVLKVDANSSDAYNNIGNCYKEMGQFELSLQYLKKAISIKPDHFGAYFNMGLVYKEIFDFKSAIHCYQKAIEINNNYAEAHWNLALLLLLHGDFTKGWEHYEWRKKLTVYEPYKRDFTKPEWQGEDLTNKVILIYDEQGFGDAIQFIRYAKMLKKNKYVKVITECLSPLNRLFKGVDGVDEVITRGYPLPPFEYHCSILTLPFKFKTVIENIPHETPYISVQEDLIKKWQSLMQPYIVKKNIGFAWSGINPIHKSCPLEKLTPLFEIKGLGYFSLQKGPAQEELKELQGRYNIVDLMNDVTDFADTSAIMMNLDLIITIDTSIAHLAGALNKPVWVLLHYDGDWRWLLDRNDSPWYPTMRLFRQTSIGDWDELVRGVKKELLLLS